MEEFLYSRQHQAYFVVGDVWRTEFLDGCRKTTCGRVGGSAGGSAYLADGVGDDELMLAGDEVADVHFAAIDITRKMTYDGAKGQGTLTGDVFW